MNQQWNLNLKEHPYWVGLNGCYGKFSNFTCAAKTVSFLGRIRPVAIRVGITFKNPKGKDEVTEYKDVVESLRGEW